MLCLDGLFASGPVMSRWRQYNWHFLIVLQDVSLPYLWQEYYRVRPYRSDEQRLSLCWANRTQQFEWQNDIDYHWGHHQRLTVHVVRCQEVQCSATWA
jgi:hypothetical protein